jgi:hypothetical protein
LVANNKIFSSDEKKTKIIEGIHLLNLLSENNLEGVQKPS